MTDKDPDTPSTAALPTESPKTRHPHTHGRLTTAIAVLALATAGYTLMRLDSARDRLDSVNEAVRSVVADQDTLRNQIAALTEHERTRRRELARRLDALDDAPRQLQDLAASMEALRGRSEGPERAWSRAEAMFLLELAQRRLTLDRDIDTAIVALESADSRLASLRDQSFAPVRQQIARELQSLRAVHWPDMTGLLARLASAEEQAAGLRLRGIEKQRDVPAPAPAQGALSRAWSVVREVLAKLIVVREVKDRDTMVVTAHQSLLRRQHLQLLLFSARTAVARHDETSYRSSLSQARQWLGEFFDLSDPAANALLEDIQALEPVDIDPPLPDISSSSRALARLTPAASSQQ